MQTRTYGDLFKLIQSLAGVGTFARTSEDDIALFIPIAVFLASILQPVGRYIQAPKKEKLISLLCRGGANCLSTATTVNRTINPPGVGANTIWRYKGCLPRGNYQHSNNLQHRYSLGELIRSIAAVQSKRDYTVSLEQQHPIRADTK